MSGWCPSSSVYCCGMAVGACCCWSTLSSACSPSPSHPVAVLVSAASCRALLLAGCVAWRVCVCCSCGGVSSDYSPPHVGGGWGHCGWWGGMTGWGGQWKGGCCVVVLPSAYWCPPSECRRPPSIYLAVLLNGGVGVVRCPRIRIVPVSSALSLFSCVLCFHVCCVWGSAVGWGVRFSACCLLRRTHCVWCDVRYCTVEERWGRVVGSGGLLRVEVCLAFLSSRFRLCVLCYSIVGLGWCFCVRVVSLWNGGDGLCGAGERWCGVVWCGVYCLHAATWVGVCSLVVLSSLLLPSFLLPRLSSACSEWRWVFHHVSVCSVGMTATGSLSRSSPFFW